MKIAVAVRAFLFVSLSVFTCSAVTAQTLPSPWLSADVGNPQIAGRSTYSSGTFTITAAGSDIWGTSDQFHFVYRPITGDVEIIVRVASITTQTHRWSKAGVMIREALTAQSRHVMMIGSAAAGYAFQRRAQTAGSSDSTAGPAYAPPGWVRLVRKGDLFSAYHSTDGVNWRLVGSDTIPMGDTVYVGLPMTSHSKTVAATAKLDSVKVIAATLPNQPPAISIMSPAANSPYTAPASIAISATATDPENAMLSVDFYANQTLITRDTTAPYSATYATSTPGTYSLTAVAHDAAGNSTTSGAVPVTVQGTSGNKPPVVTLTSPATGATFTAPASIPLSATATDAEGSIARVEFYSGTTLLWTEVNLPYADSWTSVPAGTYTLTAVAYDGQGAKTTSAPVTVTVSGTNKPPTVSLTSPTSGTTLTAPATITMTATASDPENQLAKVEFLSGNTVLFTDPSAPYAWNWSNVPAGAYSVTARVYDSAGASSTSAAVTVTVSGTNKPPTVSLTSPTSGITLTAPATINMAATASDPENKLARVEFLSGNNILFTDTAAPYAWNWSSVPAGTYTVTARAYDSAGASATSSATVTVGTIATAPKQVVFTASADHATNVTSYFFEVFAAGANPATAVAIASSDLQKPTPDANKDITVDRSALFSALAVGNYVATVTAVGPGGRTRSAPISFTR